MRREYTEREPINGRWLLLAAVLALGVGSAGLYLAGDRVSDQLHFFLASSSGGDLAAVPLPRTRASPDVSDLSEMPASVATPAMQR